MTAGRSACLLALFAILGLLVAACFFAHPIADDLDFASSARETGVWTAWQQLYLTWNGRYASNLVALATPWRSGSLGGYRAAIAMLMVANLAALYVFLRAFAEDAFTRSEILSGALIASVLFLSGMPSIGEGVYWFTSAATYQAAVVLALLHFACVVRSRRPGRPWPRILAMALLVVVVGFNEVMMVIVLAVYLALCAWSIDSGRDRGLFGTMLGVVVVCAAILVLSPGNAGRTEAYPARHHLVRSLAMTSLQTARFLGDWVSSGPLLIASALWLTHAGRFARLVDRLQTRVPLLICLAGIVLVVPMCAFPAYWATGILGQHRTVNTAYFAFLVFWFAGLALWSVSGSRGARAAQALGAELRIPLLVLLVVSLALTRNSYGLGADLLAGRLAAFDREMRERDRTLRECRLAGYRTCDIAAVQTVPTSFFVLDISENPYDWVNVAYARYYELAEVRLTSKHGIDDVRH
jgi:hypothetical protein